MAMMKKTGMKYGIIGWEEPAAGCCLDCPRAFCGFQSSLQEQNRQTSRRQGRRQLVRPPGLLPGRAAIVCFTAATAP